MLIDCRCPKCNKIVRGREEVSIVKSKAEHEKITSCPRCNAEITLVENKDPTITRMGSEAYYFDVKK